MDKFRFEHSLKNIPIPTKVGYEKLLLAKTGEFIERLRWKVFFHLNPHAQQEAIKTFGFKTDKAAPQSKEIQGFERDLFDLVTNVKYMQNPNCTFQKQLSQTIKQIKKSDQVFLLADKTTNIYKINADQYNRLLTENITKDYKQTSTQAIHSTNQEAGKIAKELKLENRIEAHSESTAYITIKDHKEDFMNKPKCRLINPAKSQIGNVSKQLLEKLNTDIRESSGLQQWRSTADVLSWFRNIQNKTKQKFLQLDIVEFYPSINEALLEKAFRFADTTLPLPVDKQTRDIVKHSRQSFLYSLNETDPEAPTPWVKKTGQFDVTMGAPDGAEVCELVGLYLIDEIKTKYPELNFGLYRDDGLAAHNRIPARRLDQIRKGLHALFKEHGLRITIETDQTVTNFLDITLDLANNTYAPYRKPNDTPLYVHVDSNHPPNVIREIPKSIETRLNTIACNKQKFTESIHEYQHALDKSGHKHKLTYIENKQTEQQKDTTPQPKKKRRKIIWFNQPFNKTVQTNIGKRFLALIDHHFPAQHPLRKVINRNCIKISYSCTKNVKSIIQSHNNKVLSDKAKQATIQAKKPCNCRVKSDCVVANNCQSGPVIYKATINADNTTKTYIGCTENFKKRYSNHKASFKDSGKKHATVLSKHVWDTKTMPNPNISWEIIQHAQPYRKGNRYCDLCLTEKLHIAKEIKQETCLNKRTDLTNHCIHKLKYRLARFLKQ